MTEIRTTTAPAERNGESQGFFPVCLSEVESAILVALSNGLHSKDIACELRRSVATIEAHIRVLCGKMNARTRTHLVANAFRAGVLNANHAARYEDR